MTKFLKNILYPFRFVLTKLILKNEINDNSPIISRVTWAILLGILAGVLLFAGGLTALQTSVVITGVPFSIIVVFACRHFYKSLESELNK